MAPDARVERCRRLGDEEDYVRARVLEDDTPLAPGAVTRDRQRHVQEVVVRIVRALLA